MAHLMSFGPGPHDAERNVIRPRPMASAGLEPSFGQEGWAHGPYYKVGVQGPRPKWVWESHAVHWQTMIKT